MGSNREIDKKASLKKEKPSIVAHHKYICTNKEKNFNYINEITERDIVLKEVPDLMNKLIHVTCMQPSIVISSDAHNLDEGTLCGPNLSNCSVHVALGALL